MGFSPRDISGLSNQHIWEFLRYYLSLPASPRYAVFIDGPWGVGKSHLVQEVVDDHFRGWKDDYVKVSLFGLSTIAEIDETLFSAIYPMLNSQGAHFIGGVMKAGLSYVSASTEMKLQKLLSNKKASLYIFDDLERCELELPKVLGYINNFVENGAKVIIIGDQSRLEIAQEKESLQRYVKEREKLVGKTLQVDPSFDEAWQSFIESLQTTAAKKFVETHSELIRSSFEQSDTQNLRLLQISLWDFERLFAALRPLHIENKEAMQALTALFFAISFEVKRGALAQNDVMQRDEISSISIRRHLSPGKEIPPLPIEISRKRYTMVDICDPLLPNTLLVDLLFRGTVPFSEIAQALDQSRFFAQQSDQPEWLRLIHILELTDDEFETAFEEMERRFQEREFTVIGELLHVFSHRLWLSRNQVTAARIATVRDECLAYLDYLYADGKLTNFESEQDGAFRFTSYAGYGFAERDEPEFQVLIAHLRTLLTQAEHDRRPHQAAALFEEMNYDPELFARRIHLSNSADNKYWNVSILSEISPDAFAARVLELSPAHQGTVIRALASRYGSDRLRDSELRTELPWLGHVRSELIRLASLSLRLSGRRINWLIQRCIDPVLDANQE